ncbi:hypothetical protein TIFTF001_012701 [Ficus carica]|uniref:Uncharacterized protein n=1 Tax=Ficus carica TaxID=3494 RepID=A0AA88D5E0_FICCA|nr:hypothetical protein TIFTF001_012701 [Ficus carica]
MSCDNLATVRDVDDGKETSNSADLAPTKLPRKRWKEFAVVEEGVRRFPPLSLSKFSYLRVFRHVCPCSQFSKLCFQR